MSTERQLSLFEVQAAYEQKAGTAMSNAELYVFLSDKMGFSASPFETKVPVGKTKQPHSPMKRKVRWHQQTLKHLGVIEHAGRDSWRLAMPQKGGLHILPAHLKLIGFSTKLGVALWSNAAIFRAWNEPIHLCLTSPPYPLKVKRNYGNVAEVEWVDFICATLEPIVKNLVVGASLVLNVTNDIFEKGSPARSLYLERLILALHDRLGLHLMDRIPWVNTSKPPAPTHWACIKHLQLAVAWEPILWFTNNPEAVRANNQRVLQPHTASHQKLMKEGGDKRTAVYGDGAYRLRPGSFSRETAGKLPRNCIMLGHSCADARAIRKEAQRLGMPAHSAMFPTALPEFFIRFLTEENELVVDPFGGAMKTGLAAERNNRRWVCTENVFEYVMQAQGLFRTG